MKKVMVITGDGWEGGNSFSQMAVELWVWSAVGGDVVEYVAGIDVPLPLRPPEVEPQVVVWDSPLQLMHSEAVGAVKHSQGVAGGGVVGFRDVEAKSVVE